VVVMEIASGVNTQRRSDSDAYRMNETQTKATRSSLCMSRTLATPPRETAHKTQRQITVC